MRRLPSHQETQTVLYFGDSNMNKMKVNEIPGLNSQYVNFLKGLLYIIILKVKYKYRNYFSNFHTTISSMLISFLGLGNLRSSRRTGPLLDKEVSEPLIRLDFFWLTIDGKTE